ncbi:MAG: hypothetical protein IJU00_12215 [Selenomonas sp.]|nr:hypothetical protein [Selenomonas sp.]
MDSLGGWISEIRGFYMLQMKTPVSAGAQALWHYLMYRANAAWWVMPLVLRSDELMGAVKLTRSSFKRAREELVAAGFLLVEPQGGRQPSRYFLTSCVRPGSFVQPRLKFSEKEGDKACRDS